MGHRSRVRLPAALFNRGVLAVAPPFVPPPTVVSPSTPVLGAALTAFPGSTADAVPMPASVAAGNQLFVGYVIDPGTTVTAPAGWTLVSQLLSQHALSSYVWRRTATGTEGSTQTFTLSDVYSSRCAQALKVAGVNTTTPLPVSAVSAHAGDASATASISNDAVHEMVLYWLMGRGGDALTLTFSTPSGYTELADLFADGGYRNMAVGFKDLVTAIGSNTVASTLSGTATPIGWHEYLLVLGPS